MRRLIVVVAAGLLIVGTTAPALAKGASRLTIEGPGLDEPLVVDVAEWGDPWELQLTTGFWPLMYGGNPKDAKGTLLNEAPAGDLGHRYVITWFLNADSYPSVTEVYPAAAGGPLVHVPPGPGNAQFGIDEVPGGWLAAEARLIELLDWYGVPVGATKSSQTQGKVDSPAPEPIAATVAPSLVTSPLPVAAKSIDTDADRTAPVRDVAMPGGDSGSTIPIGIAAVVLAVGALGAVGAWWAVGRRPRHLGAP